MAEFAMEHPYLFTFLILAVLGTALEAVRLICTTRRKDPWPSLKTDSLETGNREGGKSRDGNL